MTLVKVFISWSGAESHRIAVILRNWLSSVHHGSLFLGIHGEPPRLLEGQYWTDRKTTGSLTFGTHTAEIYRRFDDARQGKYKARK